jgi:uncharacterized membrane protein
MQERLKQIVFNICIALNGVLLFLSFFGSVIKTPLALQVVGRMHPLVLHFPIVLLLLAIVWEFFGTNKNLDALTNAGDWILLSAAFTSSLAALMGLILSKEEGYNAEGVALHQWTGIIISVLATVWFACRNWLRQKKIATVSVGAISLVGIIITAHKGANITHGENFVLAPLKPQKEKLAVKIEDAVVFTDLVMPILQEKCINCHNDNKTKGELNMTTAALITKGGKTGKLWDSAAIDYGLMLHRIHLPNNDKEHMPPTGKPQLSLAEMNALQFWIKCGSSFTKKVMDLPETDSLRIVATSFFASPSEENYAQLPKINESEVKNLSSVYRVVQPLATNSAALSVTFYGSSFFTTDALQQLSKVKNNIVELSVNKMPVTDADMQFISGLKNLEKLNIAFTNITGKGLQKITSLQSLTQLVLTGTKITISDLQSLSQLSKLNQVYLWNTAINQTDIAALKKKYPKIIFESGYDDAGVIAQLNAPIIDKEEQVFTGSTQIKLKHFINGVTLRYTTDGTEPDSTTSSIYKDAIQLSKQSELKVRAFLPGWISSETTSKMFYKTGFMPDSVRLATAPSPNYAASKNKTLTDGIKSDLNFRDGKWLGYKDDNLVSFFYFNKPVALSSVSFSTVVDIGSYIMPAYRLEVWGGNNENSLSLLKKIMPKQPLMQTAPTLAGYNCDFATTQVKILKLVAVPVPVLPPWHAGKGERGWVFVDEVFLN